MPLIELLTIIKSTKLIVFDLARSIDLHKISTEKTQEEAIAGRTSGLIEMGESVTWRAKHFGIMQELSSEITLFDRPNVFVDEMRNGAFHSFKHSHRFESIAHGCLMIDEFDYKAPLGFLGKLADGLFLKKYMRHLLEERNAVIKAFAESDRWQEVLPAHPDDVYL